MPHPASLRTDPELHALYEEAREECRSWQTLLAVMSHEIRHPLHVMRLGLARHFPRGDEPARLLFERYIDRIARVVGEANDFIRIEQDALILQRSRLDLVRLVREVADAYGPDAAARHVRLSLELTLATAALEADEHRLLQVLSNVVENALKFTPSGGAVVVTLSRRADTIDVRVRDTGRGIRADLLPKVFELYASASPERGLGIGLAVARRIVELHGGTISISSEGEGQGTEVLIRLPELAAQLVQAEARRAG